MSDTPNISACESFAGTTTESKPKNELRDLRAAGHTNATLADVQFAIAREHGFETWAKLKHHIEATASARDSSRSSGWHEDLAAAYTLGR